MNTRVFTRKNLFGEFNLMYFVNVIDAFQEY